MSAKSGAEDVKALNQEARTIWNQNAAFWDERMGDGNAFQRQLVGPATERLLDLHPGEQVLEIACGNGVFARRLAQLGAQVLASDFSEGMLERARARTTEHADRIEYRLLDATDEAQLLSLGQRRFDAAVCNMALMDMAAMEPLLSALARLLKVGGRFVFSVTHPCFNTTGCARMVEEIDRDGELITTYSVKVSRYRGLTQARGQGIIGQPTPQYYFERTLSALFTACFRAGFVLDGLEEPAFEQPGRERAIDWANYHEIPPVLAARLRLLSGK
jgi:2-polyprenyl-3-methyl-5-hydroxy-6-metoxy-1,4-benzoquinol methylase